MPELQKSGSRIEWIDICKALAIFCMVFLHVGIETPYSCKGLDSFLHYWHMPVFFVLSGIVFNAGKYGGWNNFGKFFSSRVRTLVIPLLAFAFICLVYNKMFIFPDGIPAQRGTLLQHIIWPNKYLHMFELQWFLMCLFLTEIIYGLIHNIAKGNKWIIAGIVIVILIGGHFLLQQVKILPFTLNSTVYALPMFAIGALGQKIFTQWRPFRRKSVQLVVLVSMVVLALANPGKLNVRQCFFNPLWMYPLGLFVTAVVIWFIREQEWWVAKLKIYPGIKWLGRNTLAILVLNGSVRKSIPWGRLMVSDNPFLVFGVQLLASFIIIFIIYFLVKLILKYCPWMLGKSKQ